MAFVKEYPVSQDLLDRFDWTALPLLYQGEAGVYCRVPLQVFVDYENDLVYYTGGGGVGRTTREIQPNTEVLYFKGVPIRFIQVVTDSKTHKDEILGGYVVDCIKLTINRIVVPKQLKNQESLFLSSIENACEVARYNQPFTQPKKVEVKIATEVEYI